MRTTVDLPEELLVELQRVTEAPTRREALIIAMDDFLRRRRLQRVLEAAGELDLDLDVRQYRKLDERRRVVE